MVFGRMDRYLVTTKDEVLSNSLWGVDGVRTRYTKRLMSYTLKPFNSLWNWMVFGRYSICIRRCYCFLQFPVGMRWCSDFSEGGAVLGIVGHFQFLWELDGVRTTSVWSLQQQSRPCANSPWELDDVRTAVTETAKKSLKKLSIPCRR